MHSGKKPKEPLEYLLDYCALKDEFLKTIYFQSYCSVAIGSLFLTLWERTSNKKIAQMVNEVCKKVGTRCLPPEAKINEEGMDAHAQPSTVRERSHEPPSSSSGQSKEESHEEVRNSPQGDYERSKHTILTDANKEHEEATACAEDEDHSKYIDHTLDMDKRAYTNECLSCEGVPIYGCSQLNFGDIEINFENFS